jgi:predicted regulator of Ras-like GTPase activity (Roadblock/LC7/MglB family)
LIYFRNGVLVHAALGMTSGEDVVYETLSWNDGKFILEIGTPSPAVSVQRSWSTLVLEGARRVDEARNAASVDPIAVRRDGMVGEIMRAYLASSRLFRSALIVDAAGIVRTAFLENPAEQETLSAIGAAVISFSRRSLRVASQGKPLYTILQGEIGCTVIWAVNPTTFLVVTSAARINPINALEELNKVSANLNEFL